MKNAHMFQHLKAPNDTNGNPRRCFIVLDARGAVVAVLDEGYGGKPTSLRDLVELPEIDIDGAEYRVWIKFPWREGRLK